MSLFKRKKAPEFDVHVFAIGDIVMVNGTVYKIEADALQQLAVKIIKQEQK